MQFAISYAGPFRFLATITATGPSHSGVTVTDDHVDIRMGWAFRTRIPRSAIRSVEQPVRIPSLMGYGVHGWNGRWAVNGSQSGAVRLTIDPAGQGRVLGIPVSLRTLYVSLEQPAAFESVLGQDRTAPQPSASPSQEPQA